MRYPLSMCSDLVTRETKWVSASDNAKNADGRPAPYISWGVPTAVIAGQFADVFASDVPVALGGA